MSFTGQAALEFLSDEISQEDRGESSHWRKYHSDFKFTGTGFTGLQGFGGGEKPYGLLRASLHRILQQKFRRMGKGFRDFDSIDQLAHEVADKQDRAYNLDLLRQSLTLAFLNQQFFANRIDPGSTACVIGDGFASMTSLLLASQLFDRVILINLTKTLLVDLWYLQLLMGREGFDNAVDLATEPANLAAALGRAANKDSRRVIAIQAKHHELLQSCPVDLALNIVSMQEMDPEVIAAYFADLRVIASQRKLYFYCCNREEKNLPDGTVTRFVDYPWNEKDDLLIDELCPWHQYYYATRSPFYRAYDGPIRHRLISVG